jgi:hypothetical protein
MVLDSEFAKPLSFCRNGDRRSARIRGSWLRHVCMMSRGVYEPPNASKATELMDGVAPQVETRVPLGCPSFDRVPDGQMLKSVHKYSSSIGRLRRQLDAIKSIH